MNTTNANVNSNEATDLRERSVFKNAVSDAEEYLRATATQAGEKVALLRERFQDSLHQAKVKLAEAEDVVAQKGRQAARVTDEYVHENPWYAVGVAAGVGLIVGLLIGRGR